MKKIMTMLSGVLLCTMLAGCGGAGPGDRATEFFKSFENGDVNTIIQFMPPDDRDDKEFKQMLEIMVPKMKAAIKEEGGIKSVEVTKEQIDGDKANVTLKITNGKGATETNDVDLVKVGGTWYVKPPSNGF